MFPQQLATVYHLAKSSWPTQRSECGQEKLRQSGTGGARLGRGPEVARARSFRPMETERRFRY